MRRRARRHATRVRFAGAAAAAAATFVACVTPATAAAPWWSPVALRGTALTAVTASGAAVTVRTETGTALRSTDRGRHFTAVAHAPQPPSQVAVTSGGYTWTISAAGRVLRSRNGAVPVLDPGSPSLGTGAHLLAAPAALPGAVVAVAVDGTVWRRSQDGAWSRSLLLLPQSMVRGVPAVTSITAFTQPLSTAVYVGTAGYAVLLTSNGGDDWIRAGAELPGTVTGLAADSGARVVYAATSDGLWEHRLQSLPAPPQYPDRALLARWLGIAAVTLIAAVIALGAMLRVAPRGRR
jgi:hypothetical protein